MAMFTRHWNYKFSLSDLKQRFPTFLYLPSFLKYLEFENSEVFAILDFSEYTRYVKLNVLSQNI
jgi:hypothetical protein